jgi:hyperosmotically inducible protein
MRHLFVAILCIGLSQACSNNTNADNTAATDRKAPDVADNIRQSLDRASLNDVTVKQDRDSGIVTLGGHVSSDLAKSQAETLAKELAAGQVVANEIVVTPPGAESNAKDTVDAIDDGIGQNFKAALIQNKLDDDVNYHVKAGVLTITGDVDSQATRARVEQLGSKVPNVKQVVNDLQVKNQKATTSR